MQFFVTYLISVFILIGIISFINAFCRSNFGKSPADMTLIEHDIENGTATIFQRLVFFVVLFTFGLTVPAYMVIGLIIASIVSVAL